MAKTPSVRLTKVFTRLVWICRWVWSQRALLFKIIGSLIVGLLSGSFLADVANLHIPLIAPFLTGRNVAILLIVLLSLGLLVGVCGLMAQFDVSLSERELRRLYLEHVVHETKMTTLKGVPQDEKLIIPDVKLADIFIAPQFRPNRPLVDYPVSERELADYRASLTSQSTYSPDLERMIYEAEKNWQHPKGAHQRERIDLADVWRRLHEEGAVVIQGYPGMGKSTLMQRLALHFAMLNLGQPDSAMEEYKQLTPIRLPMLLSLGKYATKRTETPELTLYEHLLANIREKQPQPDIITLLERALRDGSCLVMLDGLDEVSEPTIREQVQEQIRTLISSHSSNRFIITSRVAGYDQEAFSAYPHFTLAELDDKQIEAFLPRWCRATIQRDLGSSAQDANIEREVQQRVSELQSAFNKSPAVHELAENPLLLTLLLVMQRNSINLPRKRVDLYDVVTRTLLENRNRSNNLPEVPEAQALRRLGPLAFQMQEKNNSFVRRREVEKALLAVIGQEGGSAEEEQAEMERFLQHIRVRGGLFVSRVGDYFGFMHRTFQEYFAARYILNQIKTAPAEWIEAAVERTCRRDDLWREPFLLAVAYQTGYGRDEGIANELLRTLLERTEGSFQQTLHNTLLAATAIYEAKETEIDASLRQQTAEHLLACYEQAQRERNFPACQKLEAAMQKWLLSLPKETYGHPPLLTAIFQAISQTQNLAHQRATLTLLAVIAPYLEPCAEAVFEMLIPPLLALTNLPAVGRYQPDQTIAGATDFDIADLSLTTLSFLGKHGPAGLHLQTVKDYFAAQPEQLRLLARCSLECDTLITLTVISLASTNYHKYESAIGAWIQLRNRAKGHITEQQIDACLTIHQQLLSCAEEARYPTSLHLLAMLQAIAAQPEQEWSHVWQTYLLQQLNTAHYIHYQECVFLWNALFPPSQLPQLTEYILNHFNTPQSNQQLYAQRILSSLASYLSDLSNLTALRYLSDLSNLKYLRKLLDSRDLKYLYNLRYLRYLSNLIDTVDLSNLRKLVDLRYLSGLENTVDLRYLRYLSEVIDLNNISSAIISSIINLRYLSNIIEFLIRQDIAEKACKLLSITGKASKIDLLMMIRGRILYIQIKKQHGSEVVEEIQQLAHAALGELADEDVREAALDVLRALPARTSVEVALIQQLVANAQDQQIHDACATALERAQPLDEAAWDAIAQQSTASPALAVRKAAEAVLERRPTK
ncbi:MAG: NACHT domain-containing protein [Ktedonobacteraceae bacterium]